MMTIARRSSRAAGDAFVRVLGSVTVFLLGAAPAIPAEEPLAGQPIHGSSPADVARGMPADDPFPRTSDREATLRLAFDDWAIVWLDGTELATLDHSDGFETARIPVALKPGDNQLVIKTNNRQNSDRLIWAIHGAIEPGS